MTSCTQNRRATKLRYISTLKKEVGFEPTIGKPNRFTICHFKPLSHSFKNSKNTYFKTNLLVRRLILLIFFGRQPL